MTNIDEVCAAFEVWASEWAWFSKAERQRAWEVWQAAYAAGRRKGLEEAASQTISMADYRRKREYADAIRELIDKEPT